MMRGANEASSSSDASLYCWLLCCFGRGGSRFLGRRRFGGGRGATRDREQGAFRPSVNFGEVEFLPGGGDDIVFTRQTRIDHVVELVGAARQIGRVKHNLLI